MVVVGLLGIVVTNMQVNMAFRHDKLLDHMPEKVM